MRRRTSKRLPSPSDWNFELIETYFQAIRRTASYGLDTYPTQLELITAEQMLDAYASVGMPVNYRHWSYGKHFIQSEKSYRRGHGPGLRDRHQFRPVHRLPHGRTRCDAGAGDRARLLRAQLLLQGELPVPHVDGRQFHHRLPGLRQELRVRMRGAPRHRGGGTGAGRLPRADELRRGPLSAAAEDPRWWRRKTVRKDREAYLQQQVNDLWRTLPTKAGKQAKKEQRRFPRSRRRTSCTSSRRTRRWSPGSARSCGSCARWRSTSIRSARRR